MIFIFLYISVNIVLLHSCWDLMSARCSECKQDSSNFVVHKSVYSLKESSCNCQELLSRFMKGSLFLVCTADYFLFIISESIGFCSKYVENLVNLCIMSQLSNMLFVT